MASKSESSKGEKRQKLNESDGDSSSNESDCEEIVSDESFDENLEIPVEFEAFPPAECDFNAMKNLLKQLFFKDSVNLSELADIIISQDKIGSIIKVVDDELEEEETTASADKAEQNGPSTSNEEDYQEEILGLITALDLFKYKDKDCINQIKQLLLGKCKACADNKTQSKFTEILDSNHRLGLLLSERFINIPPQLALPLFKSLRTELEHHFKQDTNSKLKYLLLISKSYREKDKKSGKKGKKVAKNDQSSSEQELNFSNVEDEILFKESLVSFSYPVATDDDTLIGGKWSFDDALLVPYRTVMVVPYGQMNTIIEQMESLLSS